jgi:recombination protein RecT
MSELVVFQKQLDPLAPMLERALAGSNVRVERFVQSVLVSVERLPVLLECNRQSLFNAAMSAACLALPVDGVTGQSFIVPFKGKAQLIIGFMGYNTLGARGSYAIVGDVVREGDVFEIDKPNGVVIHRAIPNSKGRIIAAWARARSIHLPAIAEVVYLDELLATRQRSPAAKRTDSPWNDTDIGWPAMCGKTAKRRLKRSMPLGELPQFSMAAAMDEAVEERGLHAWITPDRGVVLEAETIEREEQPPPSATDLVKGTLDDRAGKLESALKSAKTREKAESVWSVNAELREELHKNRESRFDELVRMYEAAVSELPSKNEAPS